MAECSRYRSSYKSHCILYAPVGPQHTYGPCDQTSVQPVPPPYFLVRTRIAFPVFFILVKKFELRPIVRVYGGGPFITTCILRCHMYTALQKSYRPFFCDVPPLTPSPLYGNPCTAARNRTRPKCSGRRRKNSRNKCR